ncbi:MAG: hypothetical protein KY467_08545 [Gemmatimonadetes bacterium]|nr:hypothetical protein [Gemmatimonadota bacterium]
MRAQTPVLVLALLAAAACGPQVRSAAYLPPPEPRAQGDAAEMRIYEHTRPECAFQEIGRVTGRATLPTHSSDEIVNAMRRRARKMGGDAIIAFGERQQDAGSVAVPMSEHTVLTTDIGSSSYYVGTVIRFTGPACTSTAPGEA